VHALADDTEGTLCRFDDKQTAFFFEEFCPGMVKRLNRERSNDDEVSVMPINLYSVPACDLTAAAGLRASVGAAA
jgi:hypothetical protein